jgi:hypothetical protein
MWMAEHREIVARIGGDGQFSLQCARGAGYLHDDPAGYWQLGPYHRVGSFEKALEIFRQINIFICSCAQGCFKTLRALRAALGRSGLLAVRLSVVESLKSWWLTATRIEFSLSNWSYL